MLSNYNKVWTFLKKKCLILIKYYYNLMIH